MGSRRHRPGAAAAGVPTVALTVLVAMALVTPVAVVLGGQVGASDRALVAPGTAGAVVVMVADGGRGHGRTHGLGLAGRGRMWTRPSRC